MIAKLSDKEYFGDKTRVSNSILKILVDKTEAHARWLIENPEPPTPQMELGSLFHMLVLEPEEFVKQVVPCDMASKNSKAFDIFLSEHPGKIVALRKDLELVLKMASSVERDDELMGILQDDNSHKEMVFHWNDSHYNFPCRAKMDLFNREYGLILDLKTTTNACESEFSKSIEFFKIHMQASFYKDAYETLTGEVMDQFMVVACEKDPPYMIAKYFLSSEDLDHGKSLWVSSLGRYKKAVETGVWPGYGIEPTLIQRPYWARNKR